MKLAVAPALLTALLATCGSLAGTPVDQRHWQLRGVWARRDGAP